jgi:CIC family chloride channel protein
MPIRFSETAQDILALFFAILIGALAGFGALAFRGYIAIGQWLLWPAGRDFLEQVAGAPWWLTLLLPTAGGLAVGLVIYYLAQELRGPGVPEVMEAAALRDGYIAPRIVLLKPLCTGTIIATGGSVGREGPVVQIGSAIGSTLAQVFNFTPEKTRICLACGAAAGIAATFNAPFAGVMFAVEIILADLQIAYLGHIVLAAVTGAVVSRHFMGDFPVFTVSSFALKSPGELWVYLLLGIAAGLISVAFTHAVFGCDTLFGKIPLPEWLKPGLGGLALGVLGFITPHVFGVGYDSVNLALTGNVVLTLALFLLLAKFLATSLCLGSGMSGGIFAPSLFIGAMLGTTVAVAANLLFPGLRLEPSYFALVGMGAMVSGTTLAPITAIITIFEITNTYAILVPLMAACIGSLLTVKYLYGYSIYETKLRRRGVNLIRGHEVSILQSLKVRDTMIHQVEAIYDSTSLAEILVRAQRNPYPFFVVLDDQGELSGVLSLWDLKHAMPYTRELAYLVVAAEMKTENVFTVTPNDNLYAARTLFEEHNFSYLPVVSPQDRKKVLGILRLDDIPSAYQQQLVKERLLRLPLRRKPGGGS